MLCLVRRVPCHAWFGVSVSPCSAGGHSQTHHLELSVTTPSHAKSVMSSSRYRRSRFLSASTYRCICSYADSCGLPSFGEPVSVARGPFFRRPPFLTSIKTRLFGRYKSTGAGHCWVMRINCPYTDIIQPILDIALPGPLASARRVQQSRLGGLNRHGWYSPSTNRWVWPPSVWCVRPLTW